ncbi:MAG TPA: HAMP domain-containing sensor histidine kinase [Orrella sp.]
MAYGIVAVMVIPVWFGFNQVSSILTLVFAVLVFPVGQIIAIGMTRGIRPIYQRILISGFALGTLGMWTALLVVLYPTDNPLLPIQISRIIDYANPVVLLGLVMFHYRETIWQLAATREENVAIKLGLELEQKLREERKLMVDMLTHELKNPLASISLASGSLATSVKADDGLTKRRLENIEQSVRSMDAVIERCNIMNQLDQSALAPNMSKIGLKEMLSDAIARLADGRRVKLAIEGPNEFATDAQFFQMIVSNLIDNALKYSHTDSDVNLLISRVTDKSEAMLVMKVTNQIGSKGSPDSDLVFTRFYRHKLAHRTSGSGVGLYLTKELITLMGGRITYHPDDHQVTFCVTLPETRPNV